MAEVTRAASSNRHEVGEQRAHGLRPLRQLDGDVESETEAPFGADERPAQIVSVVLAEFAPQLDDLSARQNDGHRQHVIERDSVLEAVRAARVFGHVAADGARRFARRIRRVQQTVWCDVLVESKVDHSRLDCRATILDVERDYLLQAMQSDDDDVVRQGASQTSLVPAPRGTNGRPSSARSLTTAIASSRVPGKTASRGCFR